MQQHRRHIYCKSRFSTASTLPRNVFSSRDPQHEAAAAGSFPGHSDTLPAQGRSMPARSKTLGPGFMRGKAAVSGYVR